MIEFVQPDPTPPFDSDYGRTSHARYAALREDPALLAAVARHGRILPYPLSAGAPPDPAAR